MGRFDRPPLVRVTRSPDARLEPGRWPATIPAVDRLRREGLALVQHWKAYVELPGRYLHHVLN